MLLDTETDLRAELKHSELAPWLQQTLWRVALGAMGVKLEVEGEISPEIGSAIIAVGHHASHLDAIAVLLALQRRAFQTTTIAKQEYFGQPGLKQASINLFVPAWHAISESTEGLKHLISLISVARVKSWSELFLIFPQGTRDNPEEKSFDRGVANVARNGDVPIIPTILVHNEKTFPKGMSVPQGLMQGARRLLTGPQIEVVKFGQPIDPTTIVQESHARLPKDKDKAIMRALMSGVEQLYRDARQPLPEYVRASSDV